MLFSLMIGSIMVSMIMSMMLFIVRISSGFSRFVRNIVWCFSLCVLFLVVWFSIVVMLFVVLFEWIRCISIGGNVFMLFSVCDSVEFLCMCMIVLLMFVCIVWFDSVLLVVCSVCRIGMLVVVRMLSVFVKCIVL